MYRIFENFPKGLSYTFSAKRRTTVEAMQSGKSLPQRVFNTILSMINKCFSGEKHINDHYDCFPDLWITYQLILLSMINLEKFRIIILHTNFLIVWRISRKIFYHTARTERPHSHNGNTFFHEAKDYHILCFLLRKFCSSNWFQSYSFINFL